MKTDSRFLKITSFGFAVLFSLFLISCGSDSDSSSGISYNGVKTQATIDDTNAETLSRGAYENGELGNALSDIRPGAMLTALPGTGPLSPRLVEFSQTLEHIVYETVLTAETSAPSSKAVQSGEFEDDGPCGGHLKAKVTVDDTAGTYSAKITFDKYCDGGDILDGNLRMSGSFDPNGETFFSMVFSFNLTYQSNDEYVALQGGIDIDYDGDQAILAMDVLLKENDGKVFWIDNYSWTIEDHGSYSTIEISGRFYHPDYGYVDITTTTTTPFRVDADEDSPSSGALVISGKDNTKARLTVLSVDAYLVEVDIGDGNGWVPVTT